MTHVIWDGPFAGGNRGAGSKIAGFDAFPPFLSQNNRQCYFLCRLRSPIPLRNPHLTSMKTIAFEPLSADGLPRVPSDIGQSAFVFGANCGPVSVAALLGTQVIEVMKFFPEFPSRDYTTAADMRYALQCCGASHETWGDGLPPDGVALVQLHGPWTKPGSPVRNQLRYTHWVACRAGYVFDLNIGDWLEQSEWMANGAMSWMRSVKNCCGFGLREAHVIKPRRFEFSPFGRVPLRTAS